MSSQVVVVTGAASGIGAAIALAFAKINANLCIVDVNEQGLQKNSIECQKVTKNKVLEVVADLTKDEDLENIVKSALKEFGKIDVLVNCAGIYTPTHLQDFDIIEKFDKIFAVNLRSIVNLTNKTVPSLIESKGCVINISSVTASIIVDGALIYSMAKAAVTNFTKNAAFQLAPQGVRVNSIAPGPVKTNIFVNSAAGVTEDESYEYWMQFVKKLPLKKIIKAEDIANMAVYLASDKAATITGAEFAVDGGMALGEATNANTTNIK